MGEIWKPVVGYEGLYEVSNLGRVRSHGRYRRGRNGGKRFCPGRILNPILNDAGYPLVNLYANADTTSSRIERVHRLVAMAFLGAPPEGKDEVNHLNGDKADARPENLEWVTHAENSAHAGRTGLMAHGERHTHSKLSPQAVREARSLFRQGVTHQELANRFGVARPTITYMLNGKTWKHVQEAQ